MSDKNEFLIDNGILNKYTGESGEVIIPEGVTIIGDCAFQLNSSVTSVMLPEGVTEIGWRAFFRCKNLESILLPDSLTSIGKEAFYECESLSKIDIPAKINCIRENTFFSCENLVSVNVQGVLSNIEDGGFFNCNSLQSITLPVGLTIIGSTAFWGCKSLTEVSLPEGLLSIGNMAFDECTKLKSAIIPKSVNNIGDDPFSNCYKLELLVLKTNDLELKKDDLAYDSKRVLFAVGDGEDTRFYAFYGEEYLNYDYYHYSENGLWNEYDNALLGRGNHQYTMTARLLGAIDRLRHPVDMTPEANIAYIDLLADNIHLVIPLIKQLECPWIIGLLISRGAINEGNCSDVNRLLISNSLPNVDSFSITLQSIPPRQLPSGKPSVNAFSEEVKTVCSHKVIMHTYAELPAKNNENRPKKPGKTKKTIFDIFPNIDGSKETGLYLEKNGNAFGVDDTKHREFLGTNKVNLFFPKNVSRIVMADKESIEEADGHDGFEYLMVQIENCVITTNVDSIDGELFKCDGIGHFYVIDAETNEVVFHTTKFKDSDYGIGPSIRFLEFCDGLSDAPWKR